MDLPNGEKGIAVAMIQPHYFVEESVKEIGKAKKVKILKLDGTEYMDLSEPELGNNPSSQVKIARDDNFMYVTTYNTEESYLAKYKMPGFEKEWKRALGFNAMQSITVNNNSVICFNMTNGSIDYFNKVNGEKTNSIDIKGQWGHSHHNIAATNLMLRAGAPGMDWLLGSSNQLKLFDENGTLVNQKDIPNSIGKFNAISVDSNSNLAYAAFDNKIAIYGPQGYLGKIVMPYGKILELNADNESGSLVVSSANVETDTGGKIDIITADAIKSLTMLNSSIKLDELYDKTK